MTAGTFFLVQIPCISSNWLLVLNKYLRNQGSKGINGLCLRSLLSQTFYNAKTTNTTDCDKCHEVNKQQMCGLKPKTINSQDGPEPKCHLDQPPCGAWVLSCTPCQCCPTQRTHKPSRRNPSSLASSVGKVILKGSSSPPDALMVEESCSPQVKASHLHVSYCPALQLVCLLSPQMPK